MTLPSAATKTYLDQGTDDPKQARAELADLVDKFNDLLTHLQVSGITNYPLVVGDGLQNVANTSLAAKVASGGGIQAPAGGLQLDISGMTALTSVADADLIALYDASGSAHRKMTRSNFLSGVGGTDVQEFTSSGTWTKPSGYGANSRVLVQLWGGGGSGSRGQNGVHPGGGGGGGGYVEIWLAAADLGATETVTIGSGGASVTSDNTAGNVGGNTTFGSLVTAYGGGGGGIPVASAGGGGGGGGGALAVGSGGSTVNGGNGGGPGAGTASSDGAGGSSGGDDDTNGSDSFMGGAGGSGGTFGAGGSKSGGDSVWGGAGGGGGATSTAGNSGGTSLYGGNGGAGSIDTTAATAGSSKGGGGGGSEGGNSGAGGNGYCRVSVFPV